MVNEGCTGWGLEEMEKEHLYSNGLAILCVLQVLQTVEQDKITGYRDCRRGRGGAGWGRGLSVANQLV